MTIDRTALLYDNVYNAIGTEAVLTIADTGDSFNLTVIDKTSGVEFDMGDVALASIKPACSVRMSEMISKGVDMTKLRRSEITFNSKTWRIENRTMKPGPEGEDKGETYLILIEADQ